MRLTQEALERRVEELEAAMKSLEELNAALKVLLRNKDEGKDDVGMMVITNVKDLILPYIEKLKTSNLDEPQKVLIEIVEMHLNEIAAPFLMKLTSAYRGFTPKEIQVANLIREGRKTKDIAKAMGVSKSAIDLHRNHIRSKLGLNNKKVNLRSYLSTLS